MYVAIYVRRYEEYFYIVVFTVASMHCIVPNMYERRLF